MNQQKTLDYLGRFFKAFFAFTIIKFLADKYVFGKETEWFFILFWSAGMAIFITWLNLRKEKKAKREDSIE